MFSFRAVLPGEEQAICQIQLHSTTSPTFDSMRFVAKVYSNEQVATSDAAQLKRSQDKLAKMLLCQFGCRGEIVCKIHGVVLMRLNHFVQWPPSKGPTAI